MSGAHIALAKVKKELASIKGELPYLKSRDETLSRLFFWLWENHFKVLDEWFQHEVARGSREATRLHQALGEAGR
jgi:hypothetical protein